MKDKAGIKEQLVKELSETRRRIVELEEAETRGKREKEKMGKNIGGEYNGNKI